MKSAEQIKQDFHEEAAKVWKNYKYPKINIEFRKKTNDSIPVISIIAGHRSYTSKAIGRSLMKSPETISLRVTDKLLQMPEEQYRSFLRHEAIHIGYPRHDYQFRDVANLVNAPLTEFQAYGGEPMLHIQLKEGKRFQTIKTMPFRREQDKRDAMKYLREKVKQHNKKGRLRIQR